MLFSNELWGRSMRIERMLYVSEEGGVEFDRIRSIQMAAVGDKRSLQGSSPRHLDLTKRRPPFDSMMECMQLEGAVGNWVISGERPAMRPEHGVTSVSAFAVALRVLHRMGWTTLRCSPWKL